MRAVSAWGAQLYRGESKALAAGLGPGLGRHITR